MNDPLVAAQIVLAALQDGLFAASTGLFVCALLARRSASAAGHVPRVWLAAPIGVLALAALGYLWLQAAIMSGAPLAQAAPAIAAVLTQSHYGEAWAIGFAGALLASLACLSARGAALYGAGLVLWAAGKAAASHAADAGDFSWREAVHVVHLLATATWAGSVIVSALWLRLSTRLAVASPRERAAFCAALSHLATVSLVIVLVSGFYNVLQETGETRASLPSFFAMAWGSILAIKLTCVVIATALGGWNRMSVLPALRETADASTGHESARYATLQHRFDTALTVEAFVMLAVLVLAALLGHTSPGGV